ncbi:flagellar hook-length control protein FliK [uncultured Sulfuricurvum sp.]|uniref:flagellar hook-length control protein FliK n=1 Tax=uncultured Sulfuricurvum sp. TaxID=430693 RepID=UPI00260A8BBC|nr:flagellar hook-length control protein FliK [uncultured Sulfuricurvum sp.]
MIHLTTDARLSIILPNMNKALSEAIKNATPEQLETLKEGKDLKSVLTSVFQDKITSSKSDTVLLDILKNASVFKTMDNPTETLKSLVQDLKTYQESGSKVSPEVSAKTAVLESFLKNGATIDTTALKTQIVNSGVFMESKLASAVQKIPDLTRTLEQLRTLISNNPLPQGKALQEKITTILQSPQLAAAAKSLPDATTLSASLKSLGESVRTFVANTDPLFSKETAVLTQKLDNIGSLQELKSTLSQLYGTLLQSKSAQTDTFLDSIEKILKTITALPAKEAQSFVETIQNILAKEPLSEEIPPATGKLVDEVQEFTETLRSTIVKGNITEEARTLIGKLAEFSRPEHLVQESFLKETMSQDVKSALLSLSDELKNSADPVAPKLLEQTDKLLTQIDYHQLTSYLGASNSIYFPFSWDQLQEGSMAFKKTADKKFYCEINLRLKEYGELDLMMALYDQNQLEIQAHTEKAELKEVLMENLPELRTLLIDAGLTPRRIRIFEAKESATPLSETYIAHEDDSDLGFEVTV